MNQVVVVPYPGRGHINPLLNLCYLLSSRLNQFNHTTIFNVVVTEEWLGFLNPDLKQSNIRFVTIPNVLPSELNRGSDMISFLTAVKTKMEGPFEEVLEQMGLPVKLIIADAIMTWPFDVANRRNIPIASYWPMSASTFSLFYHIDLVESHDHLYVDLSERGNEGIDYIPGLSSLTVADIPTIYHGEASRKYGELVSNLSQATKKAQYVLLSTIYELEPRAIDALRDRLQIPIYTSGPNIPPFEIKHNPTSNEPIYLNWLDSKPPRTVLYVSLGSFIPVSSAQVDEIAFGLSQSGATFLWVARGETSRLKEMCGCEGMVVEWCDQLRVLHHSSVGGFLSHCGWNSVKEGLFSGVPMLTLPLLLDQPLNSKKIVLDWKNGQNVRKGAGVVKREEIAIAVRRFMDLESDEMEEIAETAKKLHVVCQESVAKGGSAYEDLDAFVRDIALNK